MASTVMNQMNQNKYVYLIEVVSAALRAYLRHISSLMDISGHTHFLIAVDREYSLQTDIIPSKSIQINVNNTTMKFLVLCLLVHGILGAPKKQRSYSELKSCDVGALADEIASYESVVQDIIDYAVTGPFKGKTYNE